MLSNDEQERSCQKPVRIGDIDYTPLKSREANYGPSSTEWGERDGGRGVVEVGFAPASFILIPRIINPASKMEV